PPQPARELGAAWGSQADHLALPAAREQERQCARRLARGTRDKQRARAQQARVLEEVVEQIRGEEQRAQQHLLVLVARVIGGGGVDLGGGVVRRGQRRTVSGGVREAMRL